MKWAIALICIGRYEYKDSIIVYFDYNRITNFVYTEYVSSFLNPTLMCKLFCNNAQRNNALSMPDIKYSTRHVGFYD